MGKNKLIIAAAGSGKTSFLINEALKVKGSKVLITTYTQANESEIKKKIIEINKCIPEYISVQTWFSFLLQHGVRPYQGYKYEKNITGLILINGQSATGIAESDTERHYFTTGKKIYSDKLSKFVVRCNEASNGAVIDRISRIYSHIFIDEVQDLAGYDLELLKLLFKCKINVLLVGDPRQGTYSTNDSLKNKKFKKSNIINFFEDKSFTIDTDDSSLTTNYRSVPGICEFSNKLYPDLKKTISGNSKITGHDGVFLIKQIDVEKYLQKYDPLQLRWDSRIAVSPYYPVLNFGLSKGLTFDRVLIYPTSQFIGWLKDNNLKIAPTSRSKIYVALTRARFSIGIVYDYDDNTIIEGVNNYLVPE
jgi:DNA helicase II / ATP-dependent DNA helicase PcrA